MQPAWIPDSTLGKSWTAASLTARILVPLRVNASAGDFYAAKHGGILEANHAVKIRINMNYIVMPLRGSNREQKHDLVEAA